MTNPSNAIGTNAAYGGRTSVNAFNDCLAVYSRGVMSGWACVPKSGLTVSLGGSGSVRDVAVAVDNAGNRTSINNISGSPVDVTLSAAPGANSRIDAVVAYVDNPPQGTSTVADNYGACGIIAVSGTAASTPVAPSDGAIRSAITADGASGTTAYYVVLAYITMAAGTTDIDNTMIKTGGRASTQTKLYTGPSSTTGSISLSDSVANYSRITIIFRKNGDDLDANSVTIFEADGKNAGLVTAYKTAGGVMTIYSASINVSGSSITFNNGAAAAVSSAGVAGFDANNELVITEVWGER